MRTDRLLLVAQAVRESERPQAFYMARIHTCGTPHCVFGHYVARRDLQQVFQFAVGDYAEQIYQETHGNLHNVVLMGVWGATIPVMHWRRAVADHFELTDDQVELIFGSVGCGDARTVEQAAEFIERYVAGGWAGEPVDVYSSYDELRKARSG